MLLVDLIISLIIFLVGVLCGIIVCHIAEYDKFLKQIDDAYDIGYLKGEEEREDERAKKEIV